MVAGTGDDRDFHLCAATGWDYNPPMENKPTLTIRPAGFSDAEAIFDLIRGFSKQLLSRPMSDIVKNIDRFIVCEISGKISGAVSYAILPEIGAPQNPTVEIKSLCVGRKYQRTGVGSALVSTAIGRIELLHPAQIIALTFSPEFFASLGFKVVPKEKLIHKIYAGCVNCSKYDSPLTCPEIAMALIKRPGIETPESKALKIRSPRKPTRRR
jgi:amino-acid N-acetyltransferase